MSWNFFEFDYTNSAIVFSSPDCSRRSKRWRAALDENCFHFQLDDAPFHYAVQTRQLLDQHYPQKWIVLRGIIEWPPQSPDLTTLNFFSLGHFKSVVYKTIPANLQTLPHHITDLCQFSIDDYYNIICFCHNVSFWSCYNSSQRPLI